MRNSVIFKESVVKMQRSCVLMPPQGKYFIKKNCRDTFVNRSASFRLQKNYKRDTPSLRIMCEPPANDIHSKQNGASRESDILVTFSLVSFRGHVFDW